MDGFGAFGGYGSGDDLSDANINLFCDTNTGCGFSILRWEFPMWDSLWLTDPANPANGAWPYGYGEPWAVMRKAINKGCRDFLFTVWSCPGWMKSNGTLGDGGRVLPEHYQDFADMAAKHFDYYIAEGFDTSICNLYFSPTNEPGLVAYYGSMQWNGQELWDFTKNYLGPALNPRGIRIVLGEKQWWADLEARETLEDPVSRDMVYAVAAHGYLYDRGADPDRPLVMANKYRKKTWQTEVCGLGEGCNTSIECGVGWARHIHRIVANAGASAWIWWWSATRAIDDGEALLCMDGTPRKIVYVIGNYAKFIRPGWHRINLEGDTWDVPVSSYKNIKTGRFAVVAVNTTGSTQDFWVKLSGGNAQKVEHWETSASRSLEKVGDIEVLEGCFHTTLAAMSVNTFAGDGTPETHSMNKYGKSEAVMSIDKMASNDVLIREIQVAGRMLTLPSLYNNMPVSISLYSMNGRFIQNMTILATRTSNTVVLPKSSSGVYIVELSAPGRLVLRKVIHQQVVW
jgi:glucuronoarabinoxylan endo-1,4-beta-xylanase